MLPDVITQLYIYTLTCLHLSPYRFNSLPMGRIHAYTLTGEHNYTFTCSSASSPPCLPFYLLSHLHNYTLTAYTHWHNDTLTWWQAYIVISLWPTCTAPTPIWWGSSCKGSQFNKQRELDFREGRLLVTLPAVRPTLVLGACLIWACSYKSLCPHLWQLPTYFLWSEHFCGIFFPFISMYVKLEGKHPATGALAKSRPYV